MKNTSISGINKLQSITWILLVPILLLAGFLRIYKLDQVPPSPYWEETALGYDAYSIAETGKDHHGNPYPLIAFPSFGDYKPSGYFYAIVPFVNALGLNIWAVRLPSAIAGILEVGLLYLISKEIFDEQIGILSALFFAIQPWAIQFSRGGWEVNLALTLILAGTHCLLTARRKHWMLPFSVFFFGLSMYTYHAARLFAPLIGGIGGVWILWNWFLRAHSIKDRALQRIKLLSLIGSLALLVIFLSPLLLNLGNKQVSSRFSDTSVFSNPQPVLDSNQAIAAHGGNRVAKLLYHRYWYYGAIVTKQWVSHFSPRFLFQRGDGNLRHWNGVIGELYWIEAPFVLLSSLVLILSLRKLSTVNYKLVAIFIWIGLAGIAPALVTPAPHALRFLFAAPAFAMLSAFGIRWIYVRLLQSNYRRAFVIGLLFSFVFTVSRYLSYYYLVYPVVSASDWQYGYREMYSKVGELKKPEEKAFISRKYGRPAMFYLFYTQYDPARLQRVEPTYPKDQLELLQVDDYYFIDALSGTDQGIFALPPHMILTGGKILSNITDSQRNIVWTIWRRE